MHRLLFATVQEPPVSWRPPASALGMIETRTFGELVVVSSPPTPCRSEAFRIPLPRFEGVLMTRLSRAAVEQMMNASPDATLEAALEVFEVYILDDVGGKRIAIAPTALKEKYRRG